jgi:hypothetical protein
MIQYNKFYRDRDSNSSSYSYYLLIYFMLCFIPINFGGLSINYSFMILPMIIIMFKNKIKKPSKLVVLNIYLMLTILLISIIFQTELIENSLRRLASFVVFMSFISYSFINIDRKMILSFKLSVIYISVIFSIISIIKYVFHITSGPMHFEIKNLIGTQRIGFIYLIAMWILILNLKSVKFDNYIFSKKICILYLSIILIGLLLTFSRSSIVALIIPAILYYLPFFYKGNFIKTKMLKLFIIYLFATSFLLLLIYTFFPLTIEYFIVSLFIPLFDSSLYESIYISGSSEGVRLVRINEMLNYVINNPITGSGFLGIWSISKIGSGSAHNQYIDTLLRVGVLAFPLYVYLLIKLIIFLKKYFPSLFWGMFSVIIYGMFHETFKESQGAFFLSFMIGIYCQYHRKFTPKNDLTR